jgi:hypothetical protein
VSLALSEFYGSSVGSFTEQMLSIRNSDKLELRKLFKMDTEKVTLLVILVGLVFLVGHAQSRFDVCRNTGQKNIGCVLNFN